MHSDSNKTPTILALIGAFLLFAFLFAPIPGRHESVGYSVFLVEGQGEQWGMFLLIPIAAFFVYRNEWAWAAGFVSLLVLLDLSIVFRATQGGNGAALANRGRYYAFSEPTILHWMALFFGTVLFVGAVLMLATQAWGERSVAAQVTTSHNPRLFDPRRHNPQATFGYCCFCGTKNPVTRSRCHQCHGPLAWAVQATPSGTTQPAKHASATPVSLSFLSDVDWGWWGIAVLSLMAWPIGLLLFFAYSRTGDDKGGAAIIGAGIGLILMALRFVFIMSKVGA